MNQMRTRCVRCCLDVDQMFQMSQMSGMHEMCEMETRCSRCVPDNLDVRDSPDITDETPNPRVCCAMSSSVVQLRPFSCGEPLQLAGGRAANLWRAQLARPYWRSRANTQGPRRQRQRQRVQLRIQIAQMLSRCSRCSGFPRCPRCLRSSR